MYYPKKENFATSELLPPELYNRFGRGGLYLVNPLFCITLQQLRNRFGRIRFNSKRLGLTQRGIRTLRYYLDLQKKKGADNPLEAAAEAYDRYWGMHKVGGAGDIDFLDVSKESVIDYIKENPDEFPFMSFIEVGISWFHFDVRNQPGITFWTPDDGGKVVEFVEQKQIDWSLIVDIEGVDMSKSLD